jgi:hypothetical protein
MEEVKEVLGHSSINVTERYAHLAPSVIAQAAAETTLFRPAKKIGHQIGHPSTKKGRSAIDDPARFMRRANWVPSMNVRSGFVIDLGKERKRRRSAPLEVPLVSRLLAKAEQWQGEIDRGEVRNRTALARREGRSHVYIGHLLDLLRLHPDIRAAIAALPPGTSRRTISERKLRALTRLPWERQLIELEWLLKHRKRA